MARPKQDASGLVAVVMLSDWADYKIGSVVELPADMAKQLTSAGLADSNPLSVQHARKDSDG